MYKWAVVALLWLVCFFNYADRQAIYSVFPLLKAEMGLTDVQLGVVGASFMWVYAAAAPLAGIAGDRFARRTIVVSGLIFWSLVTVATAVSTQYSHLVVWRALEGLGEAFYFPASMSMLSGYHGAATRSRAMSIHQSSVYAGTIAGGTVAGMMGQAFGWRSSFYLFGTLGALLGLVLIVCLREPLRDEPPGPAVAAVLMRRRSEQRRCRNGVIASKRVVIPSERLPPGGRARAKAQTAETLLHRFLRQALPVRLGVRFNGHGRRRSATPSPWAPRGNWR